uniref:Uncharacterized protein n=1 Tax=Amphora coffeiformis TaxID=265554 RepID=A0A7S3L5Q5_9STRA|mmetsp:Transcript_4539/g.9155  ORF Transcript_4539/g.9155 Transcript_4539/m.9155 type:complete len:304 (+) Transcript_4539:95-1006(+)|eukprot:scaffold1992_cov187-Amphora_coffeaeformis.AAC.26
MSVKATVQGYSFYLNVVVIDSQGRSEDSIEPSNSSEQLAAVEDPVAAAEDEEELEEEAKEETPAAESEDDSKNNGNVAVIPVGPVKDVKPTDPKIKLLMEGRSLVDSVFKRTPLKRNKSNEGNGKNFVQDGQRFMSSIGSSITRSGSNISKRASRFVASKTMVGRAEKAVVECIPLVTEEIGVEMSISKRFQQGPIFVLEVDMKGCDMLELLEKVSGEEAARQYRNVKEGLEALGLPDTQDMFLKEMLPKLRKAMMERMSEIVPDKMKMKKQYEDLEIQCVALEDQEEAKWLYNFLAFMQDMK